MKEDVVEGLKDQISRVPVFDILKELLQDGTIIDVSTNRRDHKLYVNDDNLLVSVPRELEEFEKAFISLLQKSIKKIDDIDFSAVSKRLGMQESDPAKWSDSEIVKYSSFEFESWKESLEVQKKNTDLLTSASVRIFRSADKIKALLNKLDKKEILRHSSNLRELDSQIEREISSLDIEPMESSYDVSDFQITLLAHGAVAIFYLLRDTIFYRSTMIWPNTIHDKETLKKLYSIVYVGIANLQLNLAEFLSSTKVRLIANPVEYKNSIEFIIRFVGALGDHTISSCVLYYCDMDMLPIIDSIATSVSKINKEIKDYGYSNPMVNQLAEGFRIIMEREETKRKKEEALASLREAEEERRESIVRLGAALKKLQSAARTRAN